METVLLSCLTGLMLIEKLAKKHLPQGKTIFERSDESFGAQQDEQLISFHGIAVPDFQQKSAGPQKAAAHECPGGPIGPIAPRGPTGPARPIGPVAPVAPVAPPAGPVGPVGPVGPGFGPFDAHSTSSILVRSSI